MRRSSLTALVVLLLLACPFAASAADPLAGEWTISGRDPGAPEGVSEYEGRAQLTREGEGYRFEAEVDGSTYRGVGLFDAAAGVFSLAFQCREDQEIGLSQYRLSKGVLEGRWATLSAPGEVGLETWRKVR